MARKKRQYVPKVKGCYECSQRRIHCDRTDPTCHKCVSRGLKCSGYGVRYRFCGDGLDGKSAKSRRIPSSRSSSITSSSSSEEINQTFKRQPQSDRTKIKVLPERVREEVQQEINKYQWPLTLMVTTETPTICSIIQDIDLVDQRTEFLLTYFSENIAPEMVVIDDAFNGWRNLILPIAFMDDLVMNSVLAVSTFHISQKLEGSQCADPNHLYARVIKELRSRSNLLEYNEQDRQLVLVTIIVLLVAVMVNGCSDFPILFHMLQSALDAVGGEEGIGHGEMAEFLLRQIHKMRVYAAPLLSRDAGVYNILFYTEQSFSCLHYSRTLHPDQASIIELITGMRQLAHSIYITRALGGGDGDSTTSDVERFKAMLELFPQGSPGEHVLVWATFIVASGSTTEEHRDFFTRFLERQHKRNGFVNIPRALTFLRRLWTADERENWVELLPEPRVFIM